MSIENPQFIIDTTVFASTIFFAISFRRKREIKSEERPFIDPKELEIDHLDPKFNGGGEDRENLHALTKIEHALKHLYRAFGNKYDWNTAKRDYASVRLIVMRMSDTEREIFNDIINP